MNFNQWRQDYDTLTFEQQQDYHDHLESLYPGQAHYDLDAAKKVFDWLQPKSVMEAGTWKADLAKEILRHHPDIYFWKGYELCPAAMKKTVCQDERFIYANLTRFDWWNIEPIVCDLFLATHFIEHLSFEHFQQLARALKCKHVYFEAPLSEYGENWEGYHGTHKLPVGWQTVSDVMNLEGYKRIDISAYCKLYEK
jgi:hypothetical protein